MQHFLLWFMPNFPHLSTPFLIPDQAEAYPPNPEQAQALPQAQTSSIEHDQERDIIVVAVLEWMPEGATAPSREYTL